MLHHKVKYVTVSIFSLVIKQILRFREGISLVKLSQSDCVDTKG